MIGFESSKIDEIFAPDEKELIIDSKGNLVLPELDKTDLMKNFTERNDEKIFKSVEIPGSFDTNISTLETNIVPKTSDFNNQESIITAANINIPEQNIDAMEKVVSDIQDMPNQGIQTENIIPEIENQEIRLAENIIPRIENQDIQIENVVPETQNQEIRLAENVVPETQNQEIRLAENVVPETQNQEIRLAENVVPETQNQEIRLAENVVPETQNQEIRLAENVVPETQNQEIRLAENVVPETQNQEIRLAENVVPETQNQEIRLAENVVPEIENQDIQIKNIAPELPKLMASHINKFSFDVALPEADIPQPNLTPAGRPTDISTRQVTIPTGNLQDNKVIAVRIVGGRGHVVAGGKMLQFD